MELDIVNVPLDLGAGRRGTDMGPSAIHVAGLSERLRGLGHAVAAVHTVTPDSFEAAAAGDPSARFLPAIASACGEVADRVERAAAAGRFPLVLGGDHSLAAGSVAGVARVHRRRDQAIGLVWVDAHADLNTPATTPSGNVHGMPLACLLGEGPDGLCRLAGAAAPAVRGDNVAVLAVRDVDRGEASLVERAGVRVYTMSELDARGVAACAAEALERAGRDTAGVYLSFDLDAIDPRDAPGVGTPVPGGLTLRESHLLCELVSALAGRHGRLLGLDMVELNPTRDVRNQTGELAAWLILSALGKTILHDPRAPAP